MLRRSLIQKEILSERRLDFLEMRADHAAQQEKVALSRLSEAKYHTKLLLEGQKNKTLSEARAELKWNSARRISDLISPGEKISPLSELKERERERALEEDRMRTLQEVEELKK